MLAHAWALSEISKLTAVFSGLFAACEFVMSVVQFALNSEHNGCQRMEEMCFQALVCRNRSS